MMDMHRTPSSRDPHEPYVREALAHLRGAPRRPGTEEPHDHPEHVGDHHFELPTIKPVGGAATLDSDDW
jgi:hypothetical protein